MGAPCSVRRAASNVSTWATKDQSVGWFIGDALATAATAQHLDQLLDLAQNSNYGMARAMIVD